MNTIDWSQFVLSIPINVPAQDLYDAWTIPDRIESWFLREARFKESNGSPRPGNQAIQAGDTYAWRWHGYTDDTTEYGEVLEANGKDFLQFVFGKAGTVSVRIKQLAGEQVLEVTQHNIPPGEKAIKDYYIGCSGGWTFYMVNLKSILEGGIDLRNRNIELRNVVLNS